MQLDEQGLRALVRWILEQLDGKVDAVSGQGLSDENFTQAYQAILDGQYEGAARGLVPDGFEAGPGSFLRSDGSWAAVPQAQSDWEETEPAAPAFILNRPFGRTEFMLIRQQTVTTGPDGTAGLEGDPGAMPESGELQVVFDGITYMLPIEPEYTVYGELIRTCVGNRYFETGNRFDYTGEPFLITLDGRGIVLHTDAGKTHSISGLISLRQTLSPEWHELHDLTPITDTEIDSHYAAAAEREEGAHG